MVYKDFVLYRVNHCVAKLVDYTNKPDPHPQALFGLLSGRSFERVLALCKS